MLSQKVYFWYRSENELFIEARSYIGALSIVLNSCFVDYCALKMVNVTGFDKKGFISSQTQFVDQCEQYLKSKMVRFLDRWEYDTCLERACCFQVIIFLFY